MEDKKESMLGSLMGKPKGKKENVEKNSNKKNVTAESFTLTIKPETIKKFNEIQWLKQYAIDFKRATRNDVLKQALDLLGENIGYDKLMEQYSEKMNGDISPTVGRKSKR